jgi:peptidoglycan/xylan/chitin deacetylase (PgdA/CDA1 family)
MNREQLNELIMSGLVTLGSHSMTHPHLRELTSKELIKEIVDSREVIKSIQGNCEVFTYPYGGILSIDENVEAVINQAGYDYALTTTGGFVRRGTDRFRIGRMNLDSKSNYLEYNRLVTSMIVFKKFIKGERYYSKISPRGVIGSGEQ